MHTVAVIAFEDISPFHLSVPCMVFGDDLARLGVPRYRLLICAERAGLIATMSGFKIEVGHDLSVLAQADTVIMPAWTDPEAAASPALLQALCAAHARGARIAGLCLGTFVLAEAGLLDGRTAATHWVWGDDFERRYPKVKLDRKSLYIDDGDILTSAGTAAAIDCCLHLLRRDHGAEVANRVARRMVVAPHRHGGQAQYIEQPLPERSGSDKLSATLDWAIENLRLPLSLDLLAEKKRHEPAHIHPPLQGEDGRHRVGMAVESPAGRRATAAGNRPAGRGPHRRRRRIRIFGIVSPTLHPCLCDFTVGLPQAILRKRRNPTRRHRMINDLDKKHLARCVDLAKRALELGDQPFGSVLVSGTGEVLFEDHNHVSGGDHTQHPEFEIARWAANNVPQAERASCTVYTSGEHCAMCSAAHGWVGLGRIVYAASSKQYAQWMREWGVAPSRVKPLAIQDVIDGATVDGPVPEFAEQIKLLHQENVRRRA